MNQDLLAPPKIAFRTFAWTVSVLGGVAIVGGIAAGVLGMYTGADLAWRLPIVAGICGFTIWLYGRLVRFSTSARPERMPYIHAAISTAGLGTFYTVLSVMLYGTGIAGGMAYMWMMPAVIGVTIALGGFGRRVGESLHCPTCEYEFTFAPEDAPERCPECATPWLGQLKKGRRLRSARMMAVGAGLAIVGMVALQPIFWLAPLAKVLPTPVLFAGLYVEPKSLYTAWDELAARPLAKPWIEIMARRVISSRNRDQWNSSGSKWFDAVAAAGKMPANLTDEYFRESFRAKLIVPGSIRAGEPFRVKLRVSRAVDGWATKIGVMFGGYSIDGGPAVGRAPEAAWGYQLRPEVFSLHRDVFEHTLTISKPGTHGIRAVYWVIDQPSFWAITWGADHVPVKPAGAVWFQRVEVEQALDVKESVR